MAKKKTTTRKKATSTRTKRAPGSASSGGDGRSAAGKHLVIVESPAKAKTINQYLGNDYVVRASVGHVRDLPARAPKGSKQPVPGVDIENHFEPTYQVLPDKKKVVTELKKAASIAADVWFATDLDREGEAIAWHLAQELGIDISTAKRVIFNAITRDEIQKAFSHPHLIDEHKVNAQQARRVLDRIVGYQVSPLLWKKVARGLSAGRVQSVAVRIIVEREREIRAFLPDEFWKVLGRWTPDVSKASALSREWDAFVNKLDEKGKPPTQKSQNAWLQEHGGFKAELVEVAGEKFDLISTSEQPRDLAPDLKQVAEAIGLTDVRINLEENTEGKGQAKTIRTLSALVDPSARYTVKSVDTRRTSTRPPAPFITSTLQMSASTSLGFGAQRTMRLAQSLYEGVQIKGRGQTGLITYMRTDSTHLSGEALTQVRSYIAKQFGDAYLPDKPNFYGSSNKAAQEAHEAIRPTDVSIHPRDAAGSLNDDQLKLYTMIWNRFVACQMQPAQWDATSILLERSDRKTGAVFKATGRVLVFDGYLRASGFSASADEQTLPSLTEGKDVAPFSITPEQSFTSPPPRYTEASLVKALESEGIGRPSTYASITQVIQDRQYVEQRERRFFATDLGMVVTDKLIEAFPQLMDLGYTRQMEEELDKIEEQHTDWVQMLENFYGPFAKSLEQAHETMTHAKAETQPAPYQCPECGSRTVYRFGKNGMFLSCSTYPECNYAAPIDHEGRPMLPEQVNIACPTDGTPMILRTGRFGKFLASADYPNVKFVVNLDRKECIKLPATPPVQTTFECPKCGAPLNLRRGKRGPWLGCSTFPKCRGRLAWSSVDEQTRAELEAKLAAHEKQNPPITLRTLDGRIIPDGTPIKDLLIPGGIAKLELHPDARTAHAKSA
jgi:DNA topoisomerase-1